MGRRTASLLVLLAVASASPSRANIPNPGLSTIPNVLISVDGTLSYTVSIQGQLGPVNQGTVELVFSAEADGLLCWCVGQTRGTLSALTDPSGTATFLIAGGGCLEPSQTASGVVCEVFVNGFKMAEVGVVGPDAVDSGGRLPTEGWTPGSSCVVGLADATFHSGPISSGSYSYCSDLNSDGAVGLQDGVLLTDPITRGDTCPRQ